MEGSYCGEKEKLDVFYFKLKQEIGALEFVVC